MKRTITLSKATDIKEKLDRSKNKDFEKITTLNKRILELQKGNNKNKTELTKAEEEFKSLQELIEEKSNTLILLTYLIAEQNQKKGRGESFPNVIQIKTRSEKVHLRKIYQDLNNNSKFKELSTEIDSIDNKLKKFNDNHTVKIEISDRVLEDISVSLE